MTRPGPPWAPLVCLLAVLLVTCSGDDEGGQRPAPAQPEAGRDVARDDGDDEDLPPPGEAHDPLLTDEDGPEPLATPSRGPRRSSDFPDWSAPEPVRLVEARFAPLPAVDRLVLEFAGPVPSWEVRETRPPILELPGRQPVDLSGESFLEVRFVRATTLERGAAEPTTAYTGPTHLESEAPGIVEAALTGDHDDRLVWTLGLADRPAVAIAVLSDPDRLVVDVVPGQG